MIVAQVGSGNPGTMIQRALVRMRSLMWERGNYSIHKLQLHSIPKLQSFVQLNLKIYPKMVLKLLDLTMIIYNTVSIL